jgi:hypothetical protein
MMKPDDEPRKYSGGSAATKGGSPVFSTLPPKADAVVPTRTFVGKRPVKAGNKVKAGDLIGHLGNSGRTITSVTSQTTSTGGGGTRCPVFSRSTQGKQSDDSLMQTMQVDADHAGDRFRSQTYTRLHGNQRPLNNQQIEFGRQRRYPGKGGARTLVGRSLDPWAP